jgi:hypothetical protein
MRIKTNWRSGTFSPIGENCVLFDFYWWTGPIIEQTIIDLKQPKQPKANKSKTLNSQPKRNKDALKGTDE